MVILRPTLRQIEYFIAIAETGSFSQAAFALGVSQPALSAQFSDMEMSLEVKLLERRSRGVILTEAGRIALSHARQILAETRALKTAMRAHSSPFSGKLNVGVLASIGAYFLPEVARQLHARYPALRLYITENHTIGLETALISGELDVIISAWRDHSDLEHVHLFDETLYICSALDDDVMAESTPVRIEDLKSRALINLGDGFGLSQTIEELAERAGGHVSLDYRGVSLDAARQMSIMGSGIAVLPSLYALTEARRDPDFVVRLIDHPMAINSVNLVWRKTNPMRDAFFALAEELLQIKAQMPDELFA